MRTNDRKSYAVIQTIMAYSLISEECKGDLKNFKLHVELLQLSASEHTHYVELNVWVDRVNEFVRDMLEKYGFVNGDMEGNKQKPNALFWCEIYKMISSIIYSPHLRTQVAAHHSSAAERNRALVLELNDILTA